MDYGQYRPDLSGQYNIPPYAPPPDNRPGIAERRRIRRLYNGVGGAMIAQYILMYVLVFISYILFSGFITEEYSEESGFLIVGFAEASIMFCAPAAASIIIFFFYNAIKGIKPSSVFGTGNFNGTFIVKAVVATFFLHQAGMLLEYAVMAVLDMLGKGTPSLEYEIANDLPTLLMNLFTSVILAPVAEEMFFRGIVLKETAKVSGRFAIVFSALMFGLMHGNPYQAVMASLVGLGLGYITIKSKSIIPAIVCHMSMNFMASISDVAYYFDESLETPVYFMVSAAEFAIGIIGFIYVLKMDGLKLPPYTDYHRKRTMPIMITSVCVIIITLVYVYEIASSIEPIEAAEDFFESSVRIFLNFRR